MRTTTILLPFLFILFLSCKKDDPNYKADNFPVWTNFTTADGLVDNWVRFIAIDPSGIKWFATANGVSKFDNKTWTSYTTSNSGLLSNNVVSMIIDNKGNTWFATENGISVLSGNTWTTYDTLTGLPNNHVCSMGKDNQWHIWISTIRDNPFREDSIAEFDGTKWTKYPRSITFFTMDNAGNLWYPFNMGGGLIKFNGTETNYSTTNQNVSLITCLTIDKKDNKWIGTNAYGATKFDGTDWVTFSTINGGIIDNFLVTIPLRYVFSIACDRSGNLWFGTDNGVNVYNGSVWVNYTCGMGYTGNPIHKTTTYNGTSWVLDSTSKVGLPENNGSPVSINYIAIDSSGYKWFATQLGVTRYTGK